MRILHLNQYGTHVGGVEGYIADVSAALAQEGHSSLLVHFSAGDAANLILDTRHAPLSQWPDPPHEAIRAIEQAIVAIRPDVAYIHAVYHPGLVRWIADRLPTVAYVHGPYPVCPGSSQYLRKGARVCAHKAGLICLVEAQIEHCCWGRNPLNHWRLLRRTMAFRQAYNSVGQILVGSKFMQRLLVRGGLSLQSVSLLPPVLIQGALPGATKAAESQIVLFAGRLAPEKGLHLLIEALARVGADWMLVVAGEGPDRERCERLAVDLGLADRIDFVGWLSELEMTAQVQCCACVAIPSVWPEPYGRVGPEAFSHGRPTVAFAVGGIPDWLEHGKSGFLVPPGDTAQLGESLRMLLESPDLRRQMGQHARQTALATWNAQAHIKTLLSTFERVGNEGT